LTNDTWFGPVGSFEGVFARMDAREVHFWGLTEHARTVPNPLTGEGVLPYHLQSYWLAVRREMFLSEAWAAYWRDLPEMPGYRDAVLRHEVVFTEHFTGLGFVAGVAFPAEEYPTENPSLLNADLLVRDGCPVVKRRVFFQWPPFLHRHAVVGRWVLDAMTRAGYPAGLALTDLARNVPPRVLNANLGLLEVLPDTPTGYDPTHPLRIAAILHAGSDGIGPVLDRLALLPASYDLRVTTDDPRRVAALEAELADRKDDRIARHAVRVVPGADDTVAFFDALTDVLEGDADIVVKAHSGRGGPEWAEGGYLPRHELGDLLDSAGYAANLVGLFQREPGLGIVFAPTGHFGTTTIGAGWGDHRPRAEAVRRERGIAVPLDDVSPLAPFGGMWVARPEALRLLSAGGGRSAAPGDGPVLDRLVAPSAGERGFHARTVATARDFGISHAGMEFVLDRIAATVDGFYPDDKIADVERAGWAGRARTTDLARMYVRLHHPGVARWARALARRLRRLAAGPRRRAA
ncbi:rhamnan synthesis F family protein, partial [Microbacterium sp. BK668]|uniref:rhamnan synthesis F family protein n=1 Tax=Microbacterium sp. BK668 TaxID=2512118 RepID=UPI00105CDB57